MTDDPRFEDDVRDAIRQLTRDPVPPSLVARVNGIPDRAPRLVSPRFSLTGPRLQWSTALVALVAVALVAGAFMLRGTGPAAVPSPSPTLPVTALSSTTPPTASPTAVPPSASPSVTAPPTALPGVALPADFQPRSVTFASPTEGWVLGSTACGSSQCAVIAHTLDAGRTWSRIPAPATTISAGPGFVGNGVRALRFADPRDGWAYGPDLWATHDGGTTWARVDLTRITGGTAVVWDLQAAAATAHMAYYAAAPLGFGIASTPVTGDAWVSPSVFLPVGAGPVPQVQLVLQGNAGWLIQVDRVVDGSGARLVGGSWQTWTPPCIDAASPAVLAAWSSTGLVADCDLGAWSTPQGEHLFVSSDGGVTFRKLTTPVPLSSAEAIAAPNASTIVVAGYRDSTPNHVIASFDSGHTWTTVIRPSQVTFNDLGFTTPTQGVLITTSGATSHLLMTRDGGHTWAAVTF